MGEAHGDQAAQVQRCGAVVDLPGRAPAPNVGMLHADGYEVQVDDVGISRRREAMPRE